MFLNKKEQIETTVLINLPNREHHISFTAVIEFIYGSGLPADTQMLKLLKRTIPHEQ